MNKLTMRGKVEALGVPLPELYYCDRNIDDLDVLSLPRNFVAKPHNGADSKGVLVVNGDIDKLSGSRIDRNEPGFKMYLRDFVLNATGTSPSTKVMIEEFIVDALYPDMVPLDYKAHCYGGRVIFFQVINRNKDQRSQSFYSRQWDRLPHVIADYPEGKNIPVPECLNDLVRYADRIASDAQQMLRLDFYVTTKGPMFGEYTTYPAAGRNFTDYGNAISIQSWELFPDAPSLY
ncbi:ATP-grasp fold amidoligase family protein [Marinimicrobium alkaliphilum]|uniref:ATP-grasp fold amidoligase family protein n=1 Tax=Marinimicrobium alkaliphilum TaxID=2202654 RepID=UPI0018E08C30|nr:ATP-grasp fold amidoligase family protein [Marinimicrobium alkaliphilum]